MFITSPTFALLLATMLNSSDKEPPREWIEPVTGHRVVRLSNDPGTSSFYFHQNGFTATGDKLVLATRRGLAVLDWKTRQIRPLVEGRALGVVVGKKTRQVYYIQDAAVRATHLDTGKTRVIVELPAEIRGGSGLAINADETLLGGSFVERGQRPTPPPGQRPLNRGGGLEARWAAHLPMRLYTVRIKDGDIKTFHPSKEWLNHVQFSPTDPTLMMFCHEGPWHKVDRIWTIRTDGSGLRKIHTRKMDMEIAGHEFFSPDGKIIWYDLQTPKGKEFWLAGRVLASDETIKYRVEREHWSVHFNVSPDGKLFAGDGGGPRSVAAPGNGQWIYLFTPGDGKLQVEKLVDLSHHDYRLEPNVQFTPDGKWIVFRSNMHGATHTYAVEVKKASISAEPRS
jgi:oligogalacturonide lyase